MDVTGNHKFWIMRGAKKSWIPASELVVGDLVMFSDRSLHRISKIDVEKLSTGVFNIEVSKNHNYYVGRNGILAHNKDCFVAGTKVLLPGGRQIDIEKVKKGDIVLSYNIETGKNQMTLVVETMRHLVEREIYTLKVAGDKVEVTGIHKFYTNRNGVMDWVPAENLVVGDLVMFVDGTWTPIESIDTELKLIRVYNLHVADNHNYYVGGSAILAHNKDCFIAGTKVLLFGGKRKNIEDIQVGDAVLSYNESNGTNQVCVVTKTLRHLVDKEIYTIQVSGEKIEVTGIHMFYSKRDGIVEWRHAEDLVQTDKIMLSDHTWHEIEDIDIDVRLVKVYNFEVSGNHNYYVGDYKGILAHNKETYYVSQYTVTTTYHKWHRNLAVHTGVPTWKEQVDESRKDEPNVVEDDNDGYVKIHFGEIDSENESKYRWYFVRDGVTPLGVTNENPVWEDNPFTKKFDFFTNQLNKQGVSSYVWPFYYSESGKFYAYDPDTNKKSEKMKYNGVLTNIWAGCEPTCAMVSKLLKNGFFCSYPWNHGVGYMFRKNTPKLVFVFANEYDNAYNVSYDYYTGFSSVTPVVVPGIKSGNVSKSPIDPYCVKQLKGLTKSSSQTRFTQFLDSIGIDRNREDSDNMTNAIRDLVYSANFTSISNHGYTKPKATVTWEKGKSIEGIGVSMDSSYLAAHDLDNNVKPFKGIKSATKLLTQDQIDMLQSEAKIPGVEYKTSTYKNGVTTNTVEKCKYYVPKTVGFY